MIANSKGSVSTQPQSFARSQGAVNKRTFGEDITNRVSHEGKSIGALSGAAIIHPNLVHPMHSSQFAERDGVFQAESK